MTDRPLLPLHGREPEWATLAAFLQRAAREPLALLIEGEAGVGKTALWQHVINRARTSTPYVLACRAPEAEMHDPFAALRQLWEGFPQELHDLLPPPQRRALEVALLRIDREGAGSEMGAIATAAVNCLRQLSARTPVLIAIDDFHWLDPSTAKVVASLLNRLDSERISMVCTVRSGNHDPVNVARGLGHDRTVFLTLQPLRLEAMSNLLVDRGFKFPPGLVLRLHRTCGGNPFFALEIAHYITSLGGDAAISTLPLPQSMNEVLGERVATLSPDARAVIEVLAVLTEATRAEVRSFLEDGTRASRGMMEAEQAGVIASEGIRLRFSHPLLASYTQAAMPSERRRLLHVQAAQVLKDVVQRGRHIALGASGPDLVTASVVEQAAGEAIKQGAPDEAAELQEAALGLTPESASREILRRLEIAAFYRRLADDLVRSRNLLERALHYCRAPQDTARTMVQLAELEPDSRTFEAALKHVDAGSLLEAEIRVELAFHQFLTLNLDAAVEEGRRALRLAEAHRAEALIVRCCTCLGWAETLLGEPSASQIVRRGADLISRGLETNREVAGHARPIGVFLHESPELVIAMQHMWSDDLNAARDLLETLLKEAEDWGQWNSLGEFHLHLAELEIHCGRWPKAVEHANQCIKSSIVNEEAQGVAAGLYARAMAHALIGDDSEAERDAREGVRLAHKCEDLIFSIQNLYSLGFTLLSRGDWEGAHQHLHRAVDIADSIGVKEPGFLHFVGDYIEALISMGEFEEAEYRIQMLERSSHKVQRRWGVAACTRCRALLTAAQGRIEEALEAADRGTVMFDDLPYPFERARSWLVLGKLQRRAKRKREARQSLHTATAMFEALGAKSWMATSLGEAGRIGGRAARPAGLSSTEERVALLAAQGLTNREIGSEMFISVRTVEANLTRAYRKLGVKSRPELRRLLSETRGPVFQKG